MERILHIGKFSSCELGGIETVINNFIVGLNPFFHIVKLTANANFSTEIIERKGYLEYNVPLAAVLARTPCCPTMPFYLRKLHKKYKFSLVHLHLPNPMAHMASLVLPASVKRVISWHSDVIYQKKALRYYQPWVNSLLKRAHAVIVASSFLTEKSLQLSIAKQRNIIHHIPFGVQIDFFLRSDYEEKIKHIREQFSRHFLVFALGRHVTYKGFSYLIEGMVHLPANCILLLGGEGPLTPSLRMQVKALKLEERVYFLGQIAQNELAAYYHACDVFCLPSIDQNEAFGIVQIEAMACAKPVISCDIYEGAGQVNQDGLTGLVVPARSPTSLAKAILKLYDEPLLGETFGKAAYCYIKEKFTYSLMLQRLKILYEEILQKTP
jgi:rhamnosyl/mannosyltransferase